VYLNIAALGVAGLSILTQMAAASTRWTIKRLGRWWKRLHRMVYAAGIIVVVHALLEAPNKRVAFSDPQAGIEIGIYLAILIALLAVRIPAVRSTLASLRHGQGAGKRGVAWK
jgi:sulfoxide reductase heme-binding subunit YedZ